MGQALPVVAEVASLHRVLMEILHKAGTEELELQIQSQGRHSTTAEEVAGAQSP
jgi:hypothetical protein